MIKHWAPAAYPHRWIRGKGARYRTVCGRWLPMNRTATPIAVTCRQCRRHLERLDEGGTT